MIFHSLDNREKEVVTHMKRGDVAAFEKLYQTYVPKLMGNMVRSVGRKYLAEELLQEVFLRVWEKDI